MPYDTCKFIGVFSGGQSCICKTILNGINYLTCLCFQEKTVIKIRQTLEIHSFIGFYISDLVAKKY